MKIEINPGDRQLAFLAVFTTVVLVIGLGVAYTDPPMGGTPAVMGHSVDEMDWAQKIQSGVSATGDICTDMGGGGAGVCLSTVGGGGGPLVCNWTGWSTCTAWQTSNQLTCPANEIVAGYQREGCSVGDCADDTRCERVRIYCCSGAGGGGGGGGPSCVVVTSPVGVSGAAGYFEVNLVVGGTNICETPHGCETLFYTLEDATGRPRDIDGTSPGTYVQDSGGRYREDFSAESSGTNGDAAERELRDWGACHIYDDRSAHFPASKDTLILWDNDGNDRCVLSICPRLAGGGGGGAGGFGTRVSTDTVDNDLVVNAVYQAQTDGIFVIPGAGGPNIRILVGNTNPPTNVMAFHSWSSSTTYGTLTTPVPSGENVQVVGCCVAGGIAPDMWWQPIGDGGLVRIS